ncbi:MAG TPA: cupin domain-containing protein [Terriglobales bacterium]|nr:cupin domain-containing protein [Terriglobales bacterium]
MKKTKATAKSPAALKNTVPAAITESALRYLSWTDVPLENMNPLFDRQLIVGHQVMLARVLLKKGCIVPLHSHVNEQLSYILEGALKFYIDGQEIIVRAGEVLTIPPNMPHKAEALEDTVDLDIFHPPRADWINKTDNYLRK